MSASDVIVHSSSEPEPLGRVIMEAIALGVPIIGTAAGGVPEMIEEGVTGYLVRRGDVGDMARKLGSVLANPGRRTNLAGEAAERARSRFSSRAFIEVMESEYRKVLRHGLERR